MRIAFTHYPRGGKDVTVWTDMPQCPVMGDSIAFDEDDERIWKVATRPTWVQEGDSWHAELSLR